ncbi:GntR family transcriptional regulator [Schnuerera ultunensis]|uniref:Putative transcriptional regulator n=1 Tax=[Clostridium] ultunense Esp TaxID=1288971 RepID=A0A1M4PQC0_9FIRM|nr:GntR family transcriptional regulator [Schnuerera ultunensis]SHD77690.1 putative transcriptional regulator [[Clostridium] ultunense Esp]
MTEYASLKDHVYKYIANKIQNGALLPGEKINEAEICEKLNISRTPAREALIQLSSENMLEYIPRRGFIVKEIDTKRKLEVYEIIGVLDALAATSAIDNITSEDILKMKELVDKIGISIKYTNYTDYMNFQNEFHDIYIKKSNNETLIEMLDTLKNNFIRQSYLSEDKEKLFTVLEDVNKEHKDIISCFERKDMKKLEDILKNKHWYTAYMDMI